MPCEQIIHIFRQILKAVSYLHKKRIIHRDLKPSNIMVSSENGNVTVIDFGHAKILPLKKDPNFALTCYCVSRHYRAPELILGDVNYDFSVDIWSLGCILAEMIFSSTLFPGRNVKDQMLRIITILGSPTYNDIKSMFPQTEYPEKLLPSKKINKIPFSSIIPENHNRFSDVLSKMLVYDNKKRITSSELLLDPLFSET